MRKQLENLFTVVCVLFISTSGVLASETPLSGNCGYMCHVPMAGEGGSSLMARRGLRPVEGNFSQMKVRFGIKPDQETAWKKFSDAVNKPMPDWHQTIQSQPPLTSTERAKLMEQIWRHRYEHMEAVTTTFQDLYEVLDDQQKRIADQRFGYCDLTR